MNTGAKRGGEGKEGEGRRKREGGQEREKGRERERDARLTDKQQKYDNHSNTQSSPPV